MIVVDLDMPEVDGDGLADMVRSDPHVAGTPMIMLTSSSDRGEAERSQRGGIVAYLTKPVRAGPLRRALGQAFGTPATASPGPVVPGEGEPVPAPASAATSETVLLVEDNVVNQKVFLAMLGSIGYRVDIAQNGDEALAALDRKRYAAVFMDCQMPVMDGYQTTQKLREREGSERHTSG